MNLQNLAAVPSVVYGLLAVAVMALLGYERKGIVLGGAIALALLILPVIIIATREAVRAVPNEIRFGSLALGATAWQTTWRQTLPVGRPGHRHRHHPGAVARHRRGGAAAPARHRRRRPLRPDRAQSPVTALPIQIYSTDLAVAGGVPDGRLAAIIVLLVMILGLNALAIFIRNKFQRSW